MGAGELVVKPRLAHARLADCRHDLAVAVRALGLRPP